MNSIRPRIFWILSLFVLAGTSTQALEVSVSATSGGTFDLTPFADYVHFTATSTSTGLDNVTLTGANVPDVSAVNGSAFTSFSPTFDFTGVPGRISGAGNTDAVDVQYAAGPASNNRAWYGAEGQGLGFSLVLPTVAGSMILFAAGTGDGVAGQASLAATFASAPVLNDSATFTAGAAGDWGARFEVSWSGRTVGETLSLQFTNVATGALGNGGVIAVVVPEPSTYAMGGLAAMTLAGIARRRSPSRVRSV